jgi:hypothetical protein
VIKTISKDNGRITLVEPIYPDIDSTLVIEGVEVRLFDLLTV